MVVGLKRELNLFETTVYGVGVILGAGIYALIGKAAGMGGNAFWMSFLIAAIIASLTGLSYAELSSIYTKDAAEYNYVKEAFKNKSSAFFIGWLMLFSTMVSVSAVALGFAGYLNGLTSIPLIYGAIGLIILMSIVNFIGIDTSSKLNIVFTFIEVAGLLIIIFLGLSRFGSVNYFEMPYGFSGILNAAILIFFAYIGFEEVANMTEETEHARKTVPRALILAILITTIIYILVSVSIVNLMPWQALFGSNAPLADAAAIAMGNNAYLLLALMALFATGNTVLILLIVTSRIMYGMSSGGSLPKFLSKIHSKTNTPYISIILVLLIASVFTLLEKIEVVANLTNFNIFIVFAMVNLSLLVLRYTQSNLKRPFKTPLNIGKFSVTAFFGFTFCSLMALLMLTTFETRVLLLEIGIIFLGLLAYKLEF